MKKLSKQQVRALTADAGFYIILLICLAVICISGYVLFFSETGEDTGKTALATPSVGAPIFSVPAVDAVITDAPTVPTVGEQTVPVDTVQETDTTESLETSEGSDAGAAVETAAEKPAPIWIRPVSGEVLRPFAADSLIYDETMGDWRTHPAVDYAAENGTRVYAISDGTVAAVTTDELYGTQLILSLKDGRTAVYRGLSERVKVKEGANVRAGDVIGTVGAGADPSEAALGSHLHLAVLEGEIPVDPEAVLSGEAKISSYEDATTESSNLPTEPVLGIDDSIPQNGIYAEE